MLHKVVYVDNQEVTFNDGSRLFSYHEQDCCESHYLSFEGLSVKDFEGLEFDLSGSEFFEKVPDYGIRLIPVNGHPISIPGYGYNNGYYSADLTLVLEKSGSQIEFNITDCQEVQGE